MPGSCGNDTGMDARGNDARRRHVEALGLSLAVAAVGTVGAVVAADAVAYGGWRVLVFAVLLLPLVPLVRRLSSFVQRPPSLRNPVRASIPPGLRTADEAVLLLVPGFSPFLAFGMGEGCGGCPGATRGFYLVLIGPMVVGVAYLYAQRRGSTPEAALAMARAVIPAVVLLLFVATGMAR